LESSASGIYHGIESKQAIALMRAHSQGASVTELSQLVKQQGHSVASAGLMMAYIKHFYKDGDNLVDLL
jgi:hypothetical protein